MYVIIAHGPNEVQVPCMIFPTKEEAEKHLNKAGIKIGECIKENAEKEVGSHFFTSYYGGCGGAYCYSIRTVEYGERFVGWNLD